MNWGNRFEVWFLAAQLAHFRHLCPVLDVTVLLTFNASEWGD